MKLIIGALETSVDTYNDRPGFEAYVQIWDMSGYGTVVWDRMFKDLTHSQWQRFRRLQDALARLPARETV